MIVQDNFLDKNLYKSVLSDVDFFPQSMGNEERIASQVNSYHNEKADCFAPYMFWDGWWRSEANTLKKKVIQKISAAYVIASIVCPVPFSNIFSLVVPPGIGISAP